MSALTDIFNKFISEVEPEIKAVVGSFSSTIESNIKDNEKGFQILASPYIRVLIDGRAPTRDGATRGNPTLQQAILAWIERHNIQPKLATMSQESLSWAISKSIHKNGTKLYQKIQAGGQPNRIFDPILTTERENKLLSLISDEYFKRIVTIAGT